MKLTILILLSISAILICPFLGMKSISYSDLGNMQKMDAKIFWQIRLPRVLTAFCAGASLAISAMVFQSLFRNALATPFTLGVCSGGAFGATLYIQLGITFSIMGIYGQSLFAFGGALLSILLVYGFSEFKRKHSSHVMLLAGVAISFSFSSLILFMQYLSDFTDSFRIMRWLMGGIEVFGFEPLLNMLPIVTFNIICVLLLPWELNLISTGEEMARSKGVEVSKIKKLLFFSTSLSVGAVVAETGPIGFIGMMSPHICRLFVGANHKRLIPATLFFGGAFLVICDTFARIIIAPAEIPVGVITSLLGGPFFLWLLCSSKNNL